MKYRINIIDDEKNLNDLVRTYLEKEGYIVYSFIRMRKLFCIKMMMFIYGLLILC